MISIGSKLYYSPYFSCMFENFLKYYKRKMRLVTLWLGIIHKKISSACRGCVNSSKKNRISLNAHLLFQSCVLCRIIKVKLSNWLRKHKPIDSILYNKQVAYHFPDTEYVEILSKFLRAVKERKKAFLSPAV